MAQKTPNLNVKNLIVEQNKSIKDALNNITTNGLGACFLTNKENSQMLLLMEI